MLCKEFSLWLVESVNAEFMDTEDQLFISDSLLLLLLSRTLCDPTDGSPPGSPLPGILQAKTLEWVAISFSNLKSITQ